MKYRRLWLTCAVFNPVIYIISMIYIWKCVVSSPDPYDVTRQPIVASCNNWRLPKYSNRYAWCPISGAHNWVARRKGENKIILSSILLPLRTPLIQNKNRKHRLKCVSGDVAFTDYPVIDTPIERHMGSSYV